MNTASGLRSDINGTGYGSAHTWKYLLSGNGYTIYRCPTCGAKFTHSYDAIPDIFKAIKAFGVAELCVAPDAKAGTGEGGNATTAPDGAGREGGK